MKQEVTVIVERFEREEISEAEALARIHELTGKNIDGYWLRNYWRSESIEDFIDRLCAEPICNFERITEAEALALIDEFLRTESPGRRDSIAEALARKFGKPAGQVYDLVYKRDLSDPDEILAELKIDTRFYH